VGADRVTRLLVNLAKRAGGRTTVLPAVLNGNAGLVLSLDGAVDLALVFEVTGARVSSIWITRNPHKLGHLATPVALR